MKNVTLTTPRLIVRELRVDDWEAIHEYGSDPEVVRHMAWGPNTAEDTAAYIARSIEAREADPRASYSLGITIRGSDRVIGGCGLHDFNAASRSALMGYCLNKSFWGMGYATEAAGALVAFAFDTLGLHRVAATCDVDNTASARVLEKLDMRREACFVEDTLIRGAWRHSYLYAVLEKEWHAKRVKEGRP